MHIRWGQWPSALLLAIGCAGDAPPADPLDPGTADRALCEEDSHRSPAELQARLAALRTTLESSDEMTAAEFAARYAVAHREGLPYDPLSAAHLPLIQGSAMALDADALGRLQRNGFAIVEARRFPSFFYGYRTIYAEDLPLYVSADSILHAVHRSYDAILESLERRVLVSDLDSLLARMRDRLHVGAADLDQEAVGDVDLYLAVALGLLQGRPAPLVATGDPVLAGELFDAARSASGVRELTLFGAPRVMDFSQFKPRGHYADGSTLERYFQSMMWLGRIDFRLLETQSDGTQVLQRRQVAGALTIREVVDAAGMRLWKRIDDVIQAFVGEADSMTLPEIDALMRDLGADSTEIASLDDDTIRQAIIAGGYGTQRISGHIMVNGLATGTLPLSRAFLVFGQRYVVDSHVLSNVVYDRVRRGTVSRMMPDPLDIAFAALRNDVAGALLAEPLHRYGYAPDLHAMRILVEAACPATWEGTLYGLWLKALRALSPDRTTANRAEARLPAVAETEAWGRRILNTQLASWAELRHDTILYAKQSYTGGAACEYPDAYVDPYPAFYGGIAALAARGKAVVEALDLDAAAGDAGLATYFTRLGDVALLLRGMAEHQQAGLPFTADQMAFINRAVSVEARGCAGDELLGKGWYADLHFSPQQAPHFDPTIADVHTQPFDEWGAPVGRVLHVGTGMPRLMVVTVDTCQGPRAYAGLVSSYFERITEGFQRLDDRDWSTEIYAGTPPDVPWMSSLVSR